MNNISRATLTAMGMVAVSASIEGAMGFGGVVPKPGDEIGIGRIVGRDAGGKRKSPRCGHNEPCHCGSGRKFKKCHGG